MDQRLFPELRLLPELLLPELLRVPLEDDDPEEEERLTELPELRERVPEPDRSGLLRRFVTVPLLFFVPEFVLFFLTAGFLLRSVSLTFVRDFGSEEFVDDRFLTIPIVLLSTSVLLLFVLSVTAEAVPRLPNVRLP